MMKRTILACALLLSLSSPAWARPKISEADCNSLWELATEMHVRALDAARAGNTWLAIRCELLSQDAQELYNQAECDGFIA
jgi:hypothetical protein